ncbi:MAG: Ku protein [Clostridia bacterium]
MRSFFKGVMGFGLVAIPISLYKALEPESVALHYVHEPCGSRIQYRKYCPVCAHEVTPDELKKAAENVDGRLVVVEVEEEPAAGRPAVHIQSFHPLEDMDPVYIGDAYWVKPDSGAVTPYRLLWEAMKKARRVAVATMHLRSSSRLALIRPYESGALMLHRMHYPDSVRREGEHFGSGPAAISDKEMALAQALIEQLAAPFDPTLYPNEPKAALMRQIASRAATLPEASPEAVPGVVDLVNQLRASLAVAAGAGR